MPLATNPKRTCSAWLKTDEEIAMEERPVFLCRFLTSHELDLRYEMLREINAMPAGSDAAYDARNKRLSEFLASGVTGWKNMGREFVAGDADQFDQVLTFEEKFELAHLTLTRPRASEIDLKKLSSGARSGPDLSANAAPADASKNS